MKVSDLFVENVIDFNRFKQARSKPVKTQANLSKHDDTVATVHDHMELLLDYIDEVKFSIRLPHFDNMDDLFDYINTTLRYPFERHNVDDWYYNLTPSDKAVVTMIGHHSNRLLKALSTIESKMNDFIKSVPKTVTMPDRIRYLQSMISHERSVLEELERLAQG